MQVRRGRRAAAGPAEVQALKYRPSSLIFGESARSTATFTGTRLGARCCMQTLPNPAASRIPDHGSGGCGSRQRSGPTGGAAKGMPLNARTPDFNVTPEINPLLILTGSGIAAGIADPEISTSAARAASPNWTLIGAAREPVRLLYRRARGGGGFDARGGARGPSSV